MQTALSRIWTRVDLSIFTDDSYILPDILKAIQEVWLFFLLSIFIHSSFFSPVLKYASLVPFSGFLKFLFFFFFFFGSSFVFLYYPFLHSDSQITQSFYRFFRANLLVLERIT